MDRPRLLLVPEFTELEWSAIRPRFEAWAEVASFDLPGVGDEPRPEILDRSVIVKRGLDELDRRGWGRCFVAVDGWGAASAIELALARPQVVIGMVIGHARLSQRREGDRAPINGAVWAALTELIAKDHEEFIRYAITQATGGSVSEELAGQMVDRFPADLTQRAWDLMTRDIDVGALLARLECPLLFAKHEGCLVSTEEGFDDAVAAFPHARAVSTTEAPLSSEGFADAVREFCEEIEAR